MQNILSFDFETFSFAKIRRVGAWAYAAHRSTEILSLSWTYNGVDSFLWHPNPSNDMAHDLNDLFVNMHEGCEFYAWNATFDYYMWNLCCVPKLGWPTLPATQVFDTMAIAQSRGLPASLSACGKALGLTDLKLDSGKYLIPKLCTPRKPSKNNSATRWTPQTAPDDFEALYTYNRQDVIADWAIREKLADYKLSEKEQWLWLDTLRMNKNGVPIDYKTADLMLDRMIEHEKELTEELQRISHHEIATANQVQKIRDYLKFYDKIDTTDLSKETVKELLAEDDLSPTSRRILEIRQTLSKSSTKKYDRMLTMADDNNRVHDILRYHQASTGRWGGSGIQVHNFPRAKVEDVDTAIWAINQENENVIRMFYDNPFLLGSKMLRSMIMAEDGHKLIVSDFSSVENRVLCWLAGDTAALDLFRKGVCQYRWFATRLYPGTGYSDVTDAQRSHAKTCILGLGFGMGADKFLETCLSYGMATSRDMARRDVNLYRKTYRKVVDYWYGCYDAAMFALRYAKPVQARHISFSVNRDFLIMHLPSGRSISYYHPKIELVETPWGEMKPAITYMGMKALDGTTSQKWCRITMIPGKIVENATQAVARDLLADALQRLRLNGYNVLFSVHDEVVCHEPVDSLGNIDKVNRIMSDTNEYQYPGLPINAEGYESKRYKKE